MPSSRRQPPPNASQREYSCPDARRVRAQSSRPEKYSVAHLPRHVVAATEPENDAEQTQRKAKVKRRLRFKRRLTLWELAGFGASCVACALLLREMVGAQADFRRVASQVHEKQAHFQALDKQRNDEKNRLAHLKSEKGRDQLLAERGYLQPGDRILLFPTEEKVGEEKEDN